MEALLDRLPAADSAATVPPGPAGEARQTLSQDSVATAAGAAVQVPGYEILDVLGRGGMGVVYKARQAGLGRVVALKMILSGGHASSTDLDRFRTEAEAIARLQHPNIVQVYEVGEQEGKPFFSLEFCSGGSLDKKLVGTPLKPMDAAKLVETLARAMQAAHDKNVIHRDLKPANVLLTEDGTAKITDFGLAKKLDVTGQTESGAIMGTPSYMAPEQAGGKSKEVGPLVDVYALGAMLYELLTGRPPFKAATPLDTVLQVLSDEPVPPRQLQSKTPRDLESVCLKCLRKEPGKRYATAQELAEDLHRFQAGQPVRARRLGIVERGWRWCRRNPVVAGLTAPIVVILLVGFVGSTYFALKVTEESKVAHRQISGDLERQYQTQNMDLITARLIAQGERDKAHVEKEYMELSVAQVVDALMRLSEVDARVEVKEARIVRRQLAASLNQMMAKTARPEVLCRLAQYLSSMAAQLEPKDAAGLCG